MTGTTMDQAILEQAASEDTLLAILGAANQINTTLKKKTTTVNVSDINKKFNDLAQSSDILSRSFANLNNSVMEASKKLAGIDVSIDPVKTDGINNEFENLAEQTTTLNKSFRKFTNSVLDASKKLGNIDISNVPAAVEGIRNNLDQASDGIGGFSGNLFDMAGSVSGANQALNLFEISSEEMSAGASEAGAAVAGLSKKATFALMALSKLADMVGGVIGMLGGLFASTVKLISQFVMGENKLSAYTETVAEALKSIPFLGGILGGLVGIVAATIKVVEGYRDVQAQLAESGAAFGQDLMYMRDMAEKTGLGMEGFAGVISKNTEIFAKFGKVTEGAVLFAKTTAILRGRMRDMGYTVEDINDGLAQVMSLQTRGSATRLQSEEDLANTAQRLMNEMDALAKLTGQSRKSQAEAVKKQTMTASFQMELAKMLPETQEQVARAMMATAGLLGEGVSEMAKNFFLGFEAINKDQAIMSTTMRETLIPIREMMQLAKAGRLTVEKQDELLARAIASSANDAKSLDILLKTAAGGMGGASEEFTKTIADLILRNQQYMEKGQKIDFNLILEKIKLARKEGQLRDEAAQGLNKFENTMMRLRTTLIEKVLTPMFNLFAPMISEFAEYFEKNVAPSLASKLDYLGEKIIDFGKSLAVLVLKISDTKWWETMIDDIGIKFQEMILDIRGALSPRLGGLNAEEVAAQKQMLRDQKEWNKSIRVAIDENKRARIEGKPVELTEKQIQEAYQAAFAKAKDYGEKAPLVEDFKKQSKKLLSTTVEIIEESGDIRKDPKTETEIKKDREEYQKKLVELRKNLGVSADFAIDTSKDTSDILNSVAQKLLENQYELKDIQGKSTYEKFRTRLRTAESFDFLRGFQEAGVRRSLTEGGGVTVGKKGAELEADTEFKKKIDEVSAKLNLDSQKLIAMMKLESGLEAGAVNRYSGATGLIQFMPKTAKGLGTSVEDLGKMTALEQMKYVEMYLERALAGKTPQGGKFSSSDLYASVFWPAAVGKPEDFIIAEKGNPVYDLNHVLDVNEDDKIQKWELGEKINQKIKEPSRSSGTLGSTGKLFEDFGKGTKVTAHNLESIMTPDQLREIVTASQERLSSEVVSKIMGSNTEAQNRMVNLLSQIREILGDSHRYHREIANNI